MLDALLADQAASSGLDTRLAWVVRKAFTTTDTKDTALWEILATCALENAGTDHEQRAKD